MPRKTEYQKQADKRTKDALRLRARFDNRIRKLSMALVTALTGAEGARQRVNRLNELYLVDISPETLFVKQLRENATTETTTQALNAWAPGEEVQLFNPTADGNGGATLELEAVFGEVAVTPPVVLPDSVEM